MVNNNIMEKILITGTGRCGTTFLIKLFTFLDFDTGFSKQDYSKYIDEQCNSGMEYQYTSEHYILKNPVFILNIHHIIQDKNVSIKQVIIPIRDYTLSAKSRVKYNNNSGGLWNAKDQKTQENFYNTIISNYTYFMTKYDINTLFIDFDRMVSDKLYLYNKLQHILSEKNINYNSFCIIYDEVSKTCIKSI